MFHTNTICILGILMIQIFSLQPQIGYIIERMQIYFETC